jgi:hypothetical protein
VPQGLQTWDASGALLVDITDRLTRFLGTISISAGAPGTVTDNGFLTGAPFCISLRTAAGTPNFLNNTMVPPVVSFAGNVMSYNAASPSGDHLLIYGVY